MKISIMIVTVILTVCSFISDVKAADPAESGQINEISLKTGEIFKVCKSGLVVCPALISICDDAGIATIVNTPDGLGFKGVAPGSTLCSVGSSSGPRKLFRITVH